MCVYVCACVSVSVCFVLNIFYCSYNLERPPPLSKKRLNVDINMC